MQTLEKVTSTKKIEEYLLENPDKIVVYHNIPGSNTIEQSKIRAQYKPELMQFQTVYRDGSGAEGPHIFSTGDDVEILGIPAGVLNYTHIKYPTRKDLLRAHNNLQKTKHALSGLWKQGLSLNTKIDLIEMGYPEHVIDDAIIMIASGSRERK